MTERGDGDTTPTARDANEAIIREQIDALIAALRVKDLEALTKIYARDVVSFDVEPPLQHRGLAAKLKNWVTVFTMFQALDYELRDLALAVGDDLAFGHGFGRLSGTLRNGAATNGMWVRVTFCFEKVDDQWLITHDQASVPFDFASGKGVTDLEP
jgi:ketosteroid isomerase-like protein